MCPLICYVLRPGTLCKPNKYFFLYNLVQTVTKAGRVIGRKKRSGEKLKVIFGLWTLVLIRSIIGFNARDRIAKFSGHMDLQIQTLTLYVFKLGAIVIVLISPTERGARCSVTFTRRIGIRLGF